MLYRTSNHINMIHMHHIIIYHHVALLSCRITTTPPQPSICPSSGTSFNWQLEGSLCRGFCWAKNPVTKSVFWQKKSEHGHFKCQCSPSLHPNILGRYFENPCVFTHTGTICWWLFSRTCGGWNWIRTWQVNGLNGPTCFLLLLFGAWSVTRPSRLLPLPRMSRSWRTTIQSQTRPWASAIAG